MQPSQTFWAAPLYLYLLPLLLPLPVLSLADGSRHAVSGLLLGADVAHQLPLPPTRLTNALPRPDPLESRPVSAHGNCESDDTGNGPARSAANATQLPGAMHHLRSALDTMQTSWFQLWIGTWLTAIDWTAAVANTHVVLSLTTLSKALDVAKSIGANAQAVRPIENELNLYFSQVVAYYFGENAFAIRLQAYDDMLWVVLGWLESVKFIQGHDRLHFRYERQQWHGSQFIAAFAHRARIFYDIASKGWDSELCGGGMTWNPRLLPYKNAITNQLFIAASVGMYIYFPGDDNNSPFALDAGLESGAPHDPNYLKAAVAGYEWLQRSNMTNDQGLYVDGFHIRDYGKNGSSGTGECDERNEMVFTYNQAVVLSGLRGLWESTGDTTYLTDGHELVRNTVKATGWFLENGTASNDSTWAGLGRKGIMEETCDASGRCSQDGQTFKGIYFNHLTLFCEPLPANARVPGKTYVADKGLASLHLKSCRGYGVWVEHNAKAALRSRDAKGRFGGWWGAEGALKGSVVLPKGSVDYRNNPAVLTNGDWSYSNGRYPSTTKDSLEQPLLLPLMPDYRHYIEEEHADASEQQSDLNGRGRGHTVETQGGGIAVIRALWEFQQLGT